MYNGLNDVEEVIRFSSSNTWFVANLGFTPGQPNLLQLDPRYELVVPKYNPPRASTPEGAFALGGEIGSIYPTVSPGGYQFFGRTVPIYSTENPHPPFQENPVLLQTGDRIRFTRVSDQELVDTREKISRGDYSYRIEKSVFDTGEYRGFLRDVREEALAFRNKRDRAARACPSP
jgi:allophanate hydrolase subunit 1